MYFSVYLRTSSLLNLFLNLLKALHTLIYCCSCNPHLNKPTTESSTGKNRCEKKERNNSKINSVNVLLLQHHHHHHYHQPLLNSSFILSIHRLHISSPYFAYLKTLHCIIFSFDHLHPSLGTNHYCKEYQHPISTKKKRKMTGEKRRSTELVSHSSLLSLSKKAHWQITMTTIFTIAVVIITVVRLCVQKKEDDDDDGKMYVCTSKYTYFLPESGTHNFYLANFFTCLLCFFRPSWFNNGSTNVSTGCIKCF